MSIKNLKEEVFDMTKQEYLDRMEEYFSIKGGKGDIS